MELIHCFDLVEKLREREGEEGSGKKMREGGRREEEERKKKQGYPCSDPPEAKKK